MGDLSEPCGLDLRLILRVFLATLCLVAAGFKVVGYAIDPLLALGVPRAAIFGLGLLQGLCGMGLVGARTVRASAVMVAGIGLLGTASVARGDAVALVLSLVIPVLSLMVAFSPGGAGFRLRSDSPRQEEAMPVGVADLGPLPIVTTGPQGRRPRALPTRTEEPPNYEWARAMLATLRKHDGERNDSR